jgi:hypothetical protein
MLILKDALNATLVKLQVSVFILSGLALVAIRKTYTDTQCSIRFQSTAEERGNSMKQSVQDTFLYELRGAKKLNKAQIMPLRFNIRPGIYVQQLQLHQVTLIGAM